MTEPEPETVLLNDHDMELLNDLAGAVTVPIVHAIAAIAAERDTVTAALSAMSDHLADMVVILQGIGWEPTYALDREAWDKARAALEPGQPEPPA